MNANVNETSQYPFILEAVKDNILSLSSLLALVNERILHSFDELKEMHGLSKEQLRQYAEMMGLHNATIHSLKLLAQTIEELRRDQGKHEETTQRIMEKLETFQREFHDRITVETTRTNTDISRINEHLQGLRMTIAPIPPVQSATAAPAVVAAGPEDVKRMPAWLKLVIILGSLGVGGTGFWKILELLVQGGGGR